MSESTTSAVSVNTNTNTNTIPTPRGTATQAEFGVLMQGVSWWSTSTQREQLGVWELYRESGELDVDFVSLAVQYECAAELLCDAAEDRADAAALLEQVEERLAELDAEQPAQEPAAPTPTVTMKQVDDTLKAFGVAVDKQASENYRIAPLAARFVDEFLGASPGKSTRTIAVDRLAAEWLRYDVDSMAEPLAKAMTTLRQRVNLLLRVNAVVNLLGDGRDVEKGDGTKTGRGKGKKGTQIPWGKLRELSPLVERYADDHSERWNVLPHVADKAAALVAEVAASGMDRAVVVAEVGKLVQEEQAARVAEAKAMADADRKAADDARALELAARKEAAEAKRTADKAAELAAAPDATPEAVDAAQVALAELRDKQEQAKAATDAAELAKAKAAQQLREEQEAEKKQADADARKATKAAKREKGETPQAPPTPTAHQGTNLLATAKQGTVKDVAEMALELVVGGDEPDSVLEALLDLLDGHKELSKASQRAVKAARLALKQGASRTVTPAAAATALAAQDASQVNGQLVAAQ